MVPEGFVDQANSIQEEETGEYVNEQGSQPCCSCA